MVRVGTGNCSNAQAPPGMTGYCPTVLSYGGTFALLVRQHDEDKVRLSLPQRALGRSAFRRTPWENVRVNADLLLDLPLEVAAGRFAFRRTPCENVRVNADLQELLDLPLEAAPTPAASA